MNEKTTTATLGQLRLCRIDEVEADDGPEELAFAREWFAVLVDLYERVVREDRIIVFETMHG